MSHAVPSDQRRFDVSVGLKEPRLGRQLTQHGDHTGDVIVGLNPHLELTPRRQLRPPHLDRPGLAATPPKRGIWPGAGGPSGDGDRVEGVDLGHHAGESLLPRRPALSTRRQVRQVRHKQHRVRLSADLLDGENQPRPERLVV